MNDDTISRRVAINALESIGSIDTEADKEYARSVFEALPSTDRPKGKWIPYLPEGLRYKCSECESKYDTPWHFCPNCGCYNGGRQSD